jgi:threonine dehydratase
VLALSERPGRARGVVACSSGNHAQGVALAARMLGVPAVIVMPADAPAMKVANTREYGAEVIHYDRYNEDRDAITVQISQDRGMTIVWPFDDVDIIAGQGTVGVEMVEQARALGAELTSVLAPVGGGGRGEGGCRGVLRFGGDPALGGAGHAGGIRPRPGGRTALGCRWRPWSPRSCVPHGRIFPCR